GYRFSGGEKQRMAIARTVLRSPPVLVWDEATSSLDAQTEAAVQAELERLSEGRTTITIAHRLSTVRDADQIVVLDRRAIAEQGTHQELLGRGGPDAAVLTPNRVAAPWSVSLSIAGVPGGLPHSIEVLFQKGFTASAKSVSAL